MALTNVPHPLATRLHDGAMQLLGAALLKTEMCEQLEARGRADEIPAQLVELRSSLVATIVELRSIMTGLRLPADESDAPRTRAA